MFKFLKMLLWRNQMQSHADWFEKHEPAQDRFEENEDWLEELEDRVVHLEEWSHKPKGLEDLEGFKDLNKRLEQLEEIIGRRTE